MVAPPQRPLRGLLALLVLLTVGCGLLSREPDGVSFAVVFSAADGLEPDDPVMLRGIQIGEVRAVRLVAGGVAVDVHLNEEHRGVVWRETRFRIEREDGLAAIQGERWLVARDPASEAPRTPLREGDVLDGDEGVVQSALDRLKDAWSSGSEAARELPGELGERARELARSPEAEALFRDLKRLADTSRELGSEQVERLKREELPRLRREAEAVRKKLEDEGYPERAKEFWRQFEAWARESFDELSPASQPSR